MMLEPFLKRELITAARRRALFLDRIAVTVLVTAVSVGSLIGTILTGLDLGVAVGARWLGLATFAAGVSVVAALALGQISATLAAAIAVERDRKTLDSLLATPLSSVEIVLGSFTAGLIKSASVLAAAVPVLILMVWLGGVHPLLLLAAGVGVAFTGLVLAALGIAVSTAARTARRAASYGLGLALSWMCLPPTIAVILPRVWPAMGRLVAPSLLEVRAFARHVSSHRHGPRLIPQSKRSSARTAGSPSRSPPPIVARRSSVLDAAIS
jgi:ABC-type transport system involved in multi-copper enzyme maturation permease subunit